jgi:hypothetical protein
MCNEQLSLDPPHVCNPDDVREYVAELKLRADQAEHKLNLIDDAVLLTLKDLTSLEGEKVEVSTKWLRKLWKAAECNFFDRYNELETFLAHWMAMHRILRCAFDLFKSRKYASSNLLKILQALKIACEDAKKILGYQDSLLDLSPEDIVKKTNDE